MLCFGMFSVPEEVLGCTNAANHYYSMEEAMIECYGHQYLDKIADMEKKILTLAAHLDSFNIFYVLAVRFNDKLIYRLFESNRFRGFAHNNSHFPPADFLYRVYTPEDIEMYNEEKKRSGMLKTITELMIAKLAFILRELLPNSIHR